MADISVNGNLCGVIAIPDDAVVVSFIINVHTLIGAPDVTFDILVNQVQTGLDVTLPGGTLAEGSFEMVVPGIINVKTGDGLRIQSNGEQVAATSADVTGVVRR